MRLAFAAALGIVDYTSPARRGRDKTSYRRRGQREQMYATAVWGLVLIGILVLLAGFSQPIVLLVSPPSSAASMFITPAC